MKGANIVKIIALEVIVPCDYKKEVQKLFFLLIYSSSVGSYFFCFGVYFRKNAILLFFSSSQNVIQPIPPTPPPPPTCASTTCVAYILQTCLVTPDIFFILDFDFVLHRFLGWDYLGISSITAPEYLSATAFCFPCQAFFNDQAAG